MEVKVTVTHELGEATKAFIIGLITANGGAAATAPATKETAKTSETSKEKTDEPVSRSRRGAAKPAIEEEKDEEEVAEEEVAPKGRARRSSKVAEEEKPAAKSRSRKTAEKVEEEPVFADLSDDEKLDEIKSMITLSTKKKGGADDIREILGVFDAARASDLDPKDYVEFYDALTRYRAGESVDEIFPEVD